MILDNKCSPFERLKALRECIDRKGFARIMETHSGLSGIIAENVRVEKNGQVLEYDGLWESSLTDSASKGLPDASIVGNDSRVHTINEILTVTSKRSEEHTSELQSQAYLVCRLLLEKKKTRTNTN